MSHDIIQDVANNLFAQYNAAAATMAMGIGNTLQFSLPGFPQPLRVKFPDYRLPVCEKCKKNYKTREMVRILLQTCLTCTQERYSFY